MPAQRRDPLREERARIERALRSSSLAMVFQPVVDLRTGVVVGAEALARFSSKPSRAPDAWFKEAHDVGLGVELELLAVRLALAALSDFPGHAYLGFNVGPATLLDPRLEALIEATPCERLVVELTEHAHVADYAAVNEAVGRLRARGVRLAIDDAGAGFSSLQHILQLRPDVIKLDRTLSNAIDTDPVRNALASALVTFALALGASLCAEGIETPAELASLQRLGVPYGQGYFLALPAPLPLSPPPAGVWLDDTGPAVGRFISTTPGSTRGAPRSHGAYPTHPTSVTSPPATPAAATPPKAAAAPSAPPLSVPLLEPVAPALRDPGRLAALRATALMDSAPEEAFDRLTRLASAALGTPIALVSLVDDTRQFFKSAVGLAEPLASLRGTPLSHSFCQHAIASRSPLVIDDARLHPLVKDNPSIVEYGVSAYAGVPLITSDNHALGVLCVIEAAPRAWSAREMDVLRDIAASVITEIDLRRALTEAEIARAELHAKEQVLSSVLESLGDGVVALDPSRRFTVVNSAAKTLLGTDLGEVWSPRPSGPVRFYDHQGGRTVSVNELPLLRALGGESFEAEDLFAHGADGTDRWLNVTAKPIRSDAGVIVGAVAVLRDVSRDRAAAVALVESESRFRLLAEHATDIITVVDADGSARYVSPSIERVLGEKAEVYLADPKRMVRNQTIAACVQSAVASRALVGPVLHRVRTKANEARWLETSFQPVVEGAEVTRVQTSSRDVTERVQVQDALRESEEMVRSILEHAPLGVLVTDLEGRVVRSNGRAQTMLGRPSSELLGKHLAELKHPDDVRPDLARRRAVLRGDLPLDVLETRYLRADGRFFWVRVSASLVRDAQGLPAWTVALLEDIDEERRIKHELAEKEEARSTIDRRYRTLVRNMPNISVLLFDHDLRYTLADGDKLMEKLRFTKDSLEGKTIWEVVTPENQEAMSILYREALAGQEHDALFWRDGRALAMHIVPVRNDAGTIIAGMNMTYDVTDIKVAEEALRQKNLALEEQAGTIDLLKAVAFDANGGKSVEEVFGKSIERIARFAGWPLGHVFVRDGDRMKSTDLWYAAPGLAWDGFRQRTQAITLGRGEGLIGCVWQVKSPAWMLNAPEERGYHRAESLRETGLVSAFAFPVFAGNDVVAVLEFYAPKSAAPTLAVLEVMANVGVQLGRVMERDLHATQVRTLSLRDDLTGLHNRRGLLELGRRQVERAALEGSELALFFVDLNDMKPINDVLGHEEGDRALQDTARILRLSFDGHAVVARLGGDEFVVLVPGLGPGDVEATEAKLRATLSKANADSSRKFRLSLSIGSSTFDPQDPVSLEALLASADARMYEEKRRRKTSGTMSIAPPGSTDFLGATRRTREGKRR